MRQQSGTCLRVGLAGALVLFGAACADQSEPVAPQSDADLASHGEDGGQELYAAELTPLNNSGVGGAAAFIIFNGELTARVYATGTVPNQLHPQHIHGLDGDQNSVCPAPSAATRIPNSPASAANPDEFISVAEGAPDYGAVRVPLDNELDSAVQTFPTANAQGIVNYLQKTSFGELQAEVEPFQLRPFDQLVVVVHGGFVEGTDGQQVYDASLPVACAQIRRTSEEELRARREGEVLVVPSGFQIEKIAQGLQLPSSLTWDDEGRLYVAEAGGGLFPEQLAPIRILRVEDGETEEVVNLSGRVQPAVVGLVWHDGAFYFTHRVDDLTGAVSRVTPDGQLTTLFSGIIDSQSEHQINDIRVGPDGRMYVAVGPTGNAGVVDLSIAPWVMRSRNVRTTPCEDIVLTGRNFQTPNFLTPDPDDLALTGAYVPFGEATVPGQVIPGVEKCGGSILAFNPNNAEATIETYAWGFRNLIGLAWNQETGEMYGGENGYDIRGSRPVKDFFDASLHIQQGQWYGVPDFSAGREPLTNPAFEPPDSLQVPVFVNGELIGRELDFLIDHEASGLTPPTPAVVLGRHEFNSSPSMLDVAPPSWGEYAGHIFVAEWGDLAPPTNPLRMQRPSGFRVVRVPPTGGAAIPFVRNAQPGPASAQGAKGEGIERPFDVQFGPDGAMYIVDYGVVTIDFSKAPPYAYQPGTGAIWKVTRMDR